MTYAEFYDKLDDLCFLLYKNGIKSTNAHIFIENVWVCSLVNVLIIRNRINTNDVVYEDELLKLVNKNNIEFFSSANFHKEINSVTINKTSIIIK